MESSLKKISNKEPIRALFATKKAVGLENNFNLSKNEESPDQASLDHNSNKVNESDREEYDDLDESFRKSTKWTEETVIFFF